tara:strand:- start:441 stop:731 length:291 start_codon:yes stop_codon:yes gene_type:complete
MSLSEDSKLKIAIFLLPLVFSAGIVVATLTSSTEAVEAEIEEVKEGLSAHSALKAHPVTESRIDTIMMEQRAIRDTQSVQSSNISAICQATGARCK